MDAQYDLHDLHDFSYKEVMKVTCDEDATVAWCLKVGLLKNVMLCPKCDGAMTMSVPTKRWRCRRSSCGDVQRSIKADSFFAKSKLPLTKAVRLMFDWASRKSVSVVTKEQEVSPTSAGDWFNFCREVCSVEMLTCEMKVRN
ncbi:hypothetical protein AaE_003017 [Aphanomyces astaci]|uniref:Transposase zinc-ribbon domain-containing protein n=2 Tax=Aphanomyces astaci TaxID=112090 RepID=A0A6A5AUY8_APHAT|nr:hypothetical protein AaE_003017 [Aphanomyces astaci]